jgi:hypothetical protein
MVATAGSCLEAIQNDMMSCGRSAATLVKGAEKAHPTTVEERQHFGIC